MAHYRGFWKELFGRSNEWVSTPAVISLVISAPVIAISIGALVYDIFWLAHGLKDTSVRLLLGLITASTAGLGASLYSKRSPAEMLEGFRDTPYVPPGDPPGRAKPAPPQGERG